MSSRSRTKSSWRSLFAESESRWRPEPRYGTDVEVVAFASESAVNDNEVIMQLLATSECH